jgi:spermidine/putrescine transport system substrate-binding protein
MRTPNDGAGSGISRRQILRRGAYGLGGLALAPILAACGGEDAPPATTGTTGATGVTGASPTGATGFDWASQSQHGTVTWANWPLYIDKEKIDGSKQSPTLLAFTDQTGIEVTYDEVIPEYASFFAKIQPVLAAGQTLDYDVLTMGFPRWLPTMQDLGYLTPLDQDRLENFYAHAGPAMQARPYDPDNIWSVPYQSGITGIGYDPELTGREITTFEDLFDPAFAGMVGMFGDTEDLPNFTMVGMGIDPPTSTPDDWQTAADKLIAQRDAGIVRKYYDTSYSNELRSGNLAITMAWSADILIANLEGFENLRFVVPQEGALLWTDSLCIPVGAANPVDAMVLMDFLYVPENAARLTAYIQNVCPVPEAQQVLIDQGLEDVANNPLVFPTDEMFGLLHSHRVLTQEEQQQWDAIFRPIYQS